MSKVVTRKVGQGSELVMELGKVSTAIGPAPVLVAPVIAAEIIRFAGEGSKALIQASRLVVNDADSAGVAADLVKAINAEDKAQEAARKVHTSSLDVYKDRLMTLFGVGRKSLADAKQILMTKLQTFQTVERQRLAEEAEAQRKLQEAEATRLAAAQFALGDAEGAEQILEEAAALPVEPVKVVSAGSFAVAGIRKVAVGGVGDRYALLRSLIDNPLEPGYAEVIESLTFSQRDLNALAKLVIDQKTPYPVGLDASEKESTNVR